VNASSRGGVLIAAVLTMAALSACNPFSSGSSKKGAAAPKGKDVSVFDLKPGSCVSPPTEVKAEIPSVRVVPCNEPHTQEAYALANYTQGDTYPGDKALRQFADGACAEKYEGYVGVPYTDSTLFFTYLLPSARGWNDGKDRSVVCLVTTTGEKLTASVKGSSK
jgi:hypothetical protein